MVPRSEAGAIGTFREASGGGTKEGPIPSEAVVARRSEFEARIRLVEAEEYPEFVDDHNEYLEHPEEAECMKGCWVHLMAVGIAVVVVDARALFVASSPLAQLVPYAWQCLVPS